MAPINSTTQSVTGTTVVSATTEDTAVDLRLYLGVVGGVVGVGLCVLAGILLWRRYRRRRQNTTITPQFPLSGGSDSSSEDTLFTVL